MRVAKELWSRNPPSYKNLRVFGCKAYCHILKELWKKCIFLGYGEPREMGFRLWDLESRKIVLAIVLSLMKARCIKTMLRQWQFIK